MNSYNSQLEVFPCSYKLNIIYKYLMNSQLFRFKNWIIWIK